MSEIALVSSRKSRLESSARLGDKKAKAALVEEKKRAEKIVKDREQLEKDFRAGKPPKVDNDVGPWSASTAILMRSLVGMELAAPIPNAGFAIPNRGPAATGPDVGSRAVPSPTQKRPTAGMG